MGIFIFIIFLLVSPAFAQEIDLSVISTIESSNNPYAYNPKTEARGLFQITPICLREWNNFHPNEQYSLDDLFDPQINTKIAKWYLTRRIPQMLRYYKKPVTIENILICYNAGIKYVLKGEIPEETRKYIEKYKRLKRRRKDV